jgi:hypothetical protein
MSCVGDFACYHASQGDGIASIGNDACHGADACYYNGQDNGEGNIDDHSCHGDNACYYNGQDGFSIIGINSCRSNAACYDAGKDGSSEIGNISCNAVEACQDNEVTIGNCQENDPIYACVIITKYVVSGPSVEKFDFTGSLETFTLGGGESEYILASLGTHSVEELLPEGWQVVIVCSGIGNSVEGSIVTLNLTSGLLVECTFSNSTMLPEETPPADPTPPAEETPALLPDRRPPNIGAGLSGLFAGQPTPLPTAPAPASAPAATSPITPPRTGDGGLAD